MTGSEAAADYTPSHFGVPLAGVVESMKERWTFFRAASADMPSNLPFG